MNKSNVFSDYMVSYSVNRSINFSPTSGKLHRQHQKSSYGPTVHLLNRSRDKNEDSTHLESKDQGYLSKILMLTMEVERLNALLKETRLQNSQKLIGEKYREAARLKQQNQKLQGSIERYQTIQKQQQRRFSSQLFDYKEKITMIEAENRTLQRALSEKQRQIQELQLRGKMKDQVMERAKQQASRMEMSMQFNSTNIDLHKSIAKQKIIQIEQLRDKIIRYEGMIQHQKEMIDNQKEELNSQKLRTIQLQNRYQEEVAFFKQQANHVEKSMNHTAQQHSGIYMRQLGEWQKKFDDKQDQVRQKCVIIATQVSDINKLSDRCAQLERIVADMQYSCHSKVVRAEEATKLAQKQKQRQLKRVNKQILTYVQQIQNLKSVNQQYQTSMAQNDHENKKITGELTNRLRQRQKEMKKLHRRSRQQQEETKMNKSLSVDNSALSNRLRFSQVNLTQLVNSMEQLKQSNDRSTKLFTSRTMASAKSLYYAQ